MKTSIQINQKNVEKISNLLLSYQKRYSVRLLYTIDVFNAVYEAEKHLETMLIPKKYWKGLVLHLLPPSVPHKYRYIAQGTSARIVRKSNYWKLEDVSRLICKEKTGGRNRQAFLQLTDLQIQHIPRTFEFYV